MKIKQFITLSLITLASAITGANAAEYFQPMSMEGVELVMPIKFGYISKIDGLYMTPGFYSLPYADKFQPNKTTPECAAYVAGGCCYHDGLIYSCEYNDSYRIQDQSPWWRIRRADTYELVSQTQLPANFAATTISLAYDATSDKIYGLIETYTEYYLVEVDPATGAMSKLGQTLDWHNKYLAVACDRDGNLYCLWSVADSGTPWLGRVRKSDGRVAAIGVLSVGNLLESDAYINGNYRQTMFFNNATNQLYWCFTSESLNLYAEYTPILAIDIENTRASMVAYLTDNYLMTGAFFREPSFAAPACINGFNFSPASDDRLSGQLEIAVPTSDYIGNPLSGAQTLTVKENGNLLAQAQVQPGETFRSDAIPFAIGSHTLSITVSNEAGEGPTVSRSLYAGYDVPAACENICLTANDLVTTLTWDAPSKGANGAAINPEGFTYYVYRYPGEVLVAEDVKERKFVETHPEELTRYVYMVFAEDQYGRTGAAAYSNNLIVGKPLSLPYGGIFNDVTDMFNYYTIIDANNDTRTWTYESSRASAVYVYHPTNMADDWLISPPINYTAGHEYVVNFMAYSSLESAPESLEVCFGPDRNPASHTDLLMYFSELPAVNEDNPVEEYEVRFTPQTDGVSHFSFHAVSEPYCEYLYLFNIRVRDAAEGGVDTPTANEPFTAVPDGAGTLRIINPTGLEFTVCDVAGRVVASGSDDAVLCLPPGIYIAGTPRTQIKVAIK